MNRMPDSPLPSDRTPDDPSASGWDADELRSSQRRLMRALLVEHARDDVRRAPARAARRRLAAVATGFAAVAGIAAVAALVVVAGVPLGPGSGSPADPAPIASASNSPTPSNDPGTTASPAPASPTPGAPVAEPGAGTGPDVGTPVTTETAYELCVAAPDPWDEEQTTPDGVVVRAAPTTSLASLADSRITEHVPGTWTVVIPVERAYSDREPSGIKVCTVSGVAESAAVSVTDSLD